MDFNRLLSKKSQVFNGIETTPLINWVLLNSKGDLRYLLKDSLSKELYKPKKKVQKLLVSKFEKIQLAVYDIIGVDIKLGNSWERYLYDFLGHKRNAINNDIRLAEGLEPIRIKTHKNAKLFYEYLENLDRYYKDFQFYKYSFVDNFEQKYCEYYGLEELPEIVRTATKEITAWYTFHRYNYEIRQISDSLVFQQTMFSDEFVELFIKRTTVKIDSVKDFAKRLEKGYFLENKSHEWLLHRREFFDKDKIKFAPKETGDINQEIAEVESALGYGIDTKNTTVSEYYNKIRVVIAKAKQAEKESNKNADHQGQ